MKLATRYLGLDLAHPIVPGASPLAADLDSARALEDAGAPCLVMNSLFEEQLVREQSAAFAAMEETTFSGPEAMSYLPEPDEYRLGPDDYLDHIRRLKEALDIPVIASVNGISPDGWSEYPRLVEEAGADALEINLYHVPSDPAESSADVEERLLDSVKAVREATTLPLAVKLSPFLTSPPYFVRRLEEAGANAAILFNRFYQPDIDIENLQTTPVLHLSRAVDSPGLNLRLRWIAILYGRTSLDLSHSGCVHSVESAIKSLMAGATTVQAVAALLKAGPGKLREIVSDLTDWMEEHEYQSIDELRGSMSHRNCPDPEAVERGNYSTILSSWTS